MLKKLLNVGVLGLVIAAPLLAGGCAADSNKGEYGLTGVDHQISTVNKARYTDQKGHYRPEWVGQQGR